MISVRAAPNGTAGSLGLAAGLFALYAFTIAGNLSETDDVYAFAYRAEHFPIDYISDPRLMLYHMGMRLLYLANDALGINLRALALMRAVSFVCAIAAVLLVRRIMLRHLGATPAAAMLAAMLLAFSYGWWRYAVEAEVYIPASLLLLLMFAWLARSSSQAALWPGVAAGLIILFYQPALILLLAAFPLLIQEPSRHQRRIVYLAAALVVAIAGYWAGAVAHLSRMPEPASFREFLAQRSEEFMVPPLSAATVVKSTVRAQLTLAHDIASASWLFGSDTVATWIHRLFPWNIIEEERYLAERAPAPLFVIAAAFMLLLAAGGWLMIEALRAWRGRGFLPPARQAWRTITAVPAPLRCLLLWFLLNCAVIARLNPAGAEAFIMVLPPLALLAGCLVFDPLVRAGKPIPAVVFVGALALHNWLGGMSLVQSPEHDYDHVRGGWLMAQAGPDDLIVVAEDAGFAESLRYLTPAQVALIRSWWRPRLADALVRGDWSAGPVVTFGRDFDWQPLEDLIERTKPNGRVFVFDDFFDSPVGRPARIALTPGTPLPGTVAPTAPTTEDAAAEALSRLKERSRAVACRDGRPWVWVVSGTQEPPPSGCSS